MATDCPDGKRHEAQRLHGRAGDHPATIGSQPGHCQRCDQLEDRPHEHRHAGHHARGHRAEAQGQGEGRDVGFTAADHQAEGCRVGGRDPQIAAQAGPWQKPCGRRPAERVGRHGVGSTIFRKYLDFDDVAACLYFFRHRAV